MHQTFNCPHCGAPGQVNYGHASYACTCRLTHQGHYKSTDEASQQRELARLRRELDDIIAMAERREDELHRELAEAKATASARGALLDSYVLGGWVDAERLARELAEAQRERDALLRLVDDVEQMAVDDKSGCTTCTRVVNACVSFAAMAAPVPPSID